jgi:long-chain acyl-CoA synthetase
MAANHSSHLDTAAIISALSTALGKRRAQQLHVVGAQDYFFNSPLRSWVFSNCLNVVPIERDEVSLSGLRRIRSILAAGQPVLIFPEGTRSRDGSLQGFRPGIGLIAYEMRVPIIPAHLSGTYAALPPGRTLPRRTQITVAFGSPILIEDYGRDEAEGPNDEIYRRITSDVRAAVELLGEKTSSHSESAS